jgi:hypothetical protein
VFDLVIGEGVTLDFLLVTYKSSLGALQQERLKEGLISRDYFA